MQSFTTQSHQRNYQGNVVVENPHYQTRLQKKRRSVWSGVTTGIMALAIIVTSGLWSATAIHNHQLKQEIQTLSLQTAELNANTNEQTYEQIEHQPRTLELRPAHASFNQPTDNDKKTEKGTRRVPISDKQYEVHPLPQVRDDYQVKRINN